MMDGKRIDITSLNLLLYGELDPEFPTRRKSQQELKAYRIAEACIKPKDIKLYKDGSRWGVSFYGKPQIGFPIIFGTGGEMKHDRFEDLFYTPSNYNIIPLNNIWDANTTRNRINQNSNIREINGREDNGTLYWARSRYGEFLSKSIKT